MPTELRDFLLAGDESQAQFKIFGVHGIVVHIESTHDERYCLSIDPKDWEIIKIYIDEQFKNQ